MCENNAYCDLKNPFSNMSSSFYRFQNDAVDLTIKN
jgi:hypothetical protein